MTDTKALAMRALNTEVRPVVRSRAISSEIDGVPPVTMVYMAVSDGITEAQIPIGGGLTLAEAQANAQLFAQRLGNAVRALKG